MHEILGDHLLACSSELNALDFLSGRKPIVLDVERSFTATEGFFIILI